MPSRRLDERAQDALGACYAIDSEARDRALRRLALLDCRDQPRDVSPPQAAVLGRLSVDRLKLQVRLGCGL
jgi:hypothetical protein